MKDMLTFCNFKVIRANCSLLFLKSNRRNVKNVKSVKKKCRQLSVPLELGEYSLEPGTVYILGKFFIFFFNFSALKFTLGKNYAINKNVVCFSIRRGPGIIVP